MEPTQKDAKPTKVNDREKKQPDLGPLAKELPNGMFKRVRELSPLECDPAISAILRHPWDLKNTQTLLDSLEAENRPDKTNK